MESFTKESNSALCLETKAFWRTGFSMSDIAERVERIAREKQELERRLTEALEEKNALNLRCAQADIELNSERVRLSAEIGELQKQLAESLSGTSKGGSGKGRQQAELAAKEKLIRDEFERKIQELQLELKRERHQVAKRLEGIKRQQTGCICQPNAAGRAIRTS